MRYLSIPNPIFIYQGFFRSRKWFEVKRDIGNVLIPESIPRFLTKDFYVGSNVCSKFNMVASEVYQ
tara:strand:+ start:98 stop:295 length:198 start_codon:yes stop_codon:yes gene_type:complete